MPVKANCRQRSLRGWSRIDTERERERERERTTYILNISNLNNLDIMTNHVTKVQPISHQTLQRHRSGSTDGFASGGLHGGEFQLMDAGLQCI